MFESRTYFFQGVRVRLRREELRWALDRLRILILSTISISAQHISIIGLKLYNWSINRVINQFKSWMSRDSSSSGPSLSPHCFLYQLNSTQIHELEVFQLCLCQTQTAFISNFIASLIQYRKYKGKELWGQASAPWPRSSNLCLQVCFRLPRNIPTEAELF